jgi:hypothetical protein
MRGRTGQGRRRRQSGAQSGGAVASGAVSTPPPRRTRVGLAELLLELRDAHVDLVLGGGVGDERRRRRADRHLARGAELLDDGALDLHAEVLGDELGAGDDGDVLQQRLAALAEAGRLDRGDVEDAAQLVDDERRERLAGHVLGDQQQRRVEARHLEGGRGVGVG